MEKRSLVLGLALAVGALMSVPRVNALTFSVSGPDVDAGETISAEAEFTFDDVNDLLCIELTNTSLIDPDRAVQILTGIGFNILGDPTITPDSVMLTGGSSVEGGSDGGGDLSGEYAFGSFGLLDYAVYSAGFGSNGQPIDETKNLDDPVSVNGINYGIAPSGQTTGNDNGSLAGEPLVLDSVTIKLNAPDGFDLNTITDVTFFWGTDGEVIPEPTGFLLTAMGLGLFACLRRRSHA